MKRRLARLEYPGLHSASAVKVSLLLLLFPSTFTVDPAPGYLR